MNSLLSTSKLANVNYVAVFRFTRDEVKSLQCCNGTITTTWPWGNATGEMAKNQALVSIPVQEKWTNNEQQNCSFKKKGKRDNHDQTRQIIPTSSLIHTGLCTAESCQSSAKSARSTLPSQVSFGPVFESLLLKNFTGLCTRHQSVACHQPNGP
jgi:hypothetical protein